MKAQLNLTLALAALVMAPAAFAQDEQATVFAAYYRCNQAQEARTDTIWQEVIAPIWQRHQDAGRITAYGWARHWAGGAWRRIAYTVGSDLETLVDVRSEFIQEVQQNHQAEMREFNSICSSHDDYIWNSVAASEPPLEVAQDRPGAGLSSYMLCDSREGQADEIFQTAFAPIMNRHVQAGDVNSWLWLQHSVGGWYRRALVLDAVDYKAILNYWNKLWEDIEAEQPELLREFAAICNTHADYVWDLSLNQ
jgi:hypothetical protein